MACLAKIAGRIAVGTAGKTGIVLADILAEAAKARGSLVGVLSVVDFDAKNLPQQVIVHTFPRFYTIDAYIVILGARGDFHPVFSSNGNDERHQIVDLCLDFIFVRVWRKPVFLQLGETFLALAVPVHDAYDRPPRTTSQCIRYAFVGFHMKCAVHDRGEEDGVVAPDEAGGADPLGQPGERLHPGGHGRGALLQGARIVQDGVLEIVAVSEVIQFIQVGHERAGVARPEYDRIHGLRPQIDARHLAGLVWIGYVAETGPDTRHEPPGVVCRDIGSPAGADDQDTPSVINQPEAGFSK